MLNRRTILLLLTVATTYAAAHLVFNRNEEVTPGFSWSSSIDGINQVTHIVSPYVFKHLNRIPLPDVDFTGGKMTNIKMTLHQPEDLERDIDFSLNPLNNSLIFTGEELFAEIVGDFTAKLLLIQVSGTAYVNITGMGFEMEVALTT